MHEQLGNTVHTNIQYEIINNSYKHSISSVINKTKQTNIIIRLIK